MKGRTESVIPPDPSSPVPAWRHYYILKTAEEKIFKELEEQDSESLLVGLGIAYLFIPSDRPEGEPGKRFSMSHGYLVDCEDEDVEEEERQETEPAGEQNPEPQEDGLDEDFISHLYEEVRDLILENAPPNSGEYLVGIEVTTAHCSKPKLVCQGRKCDFCAKHHKKHLLRKKKNNKKNICVWSCTGRSCGS